MKRNKKKSFANKTLGLFALFAGVALSACSSPPSSSLTDSSPSESSSVGEASFTAVSFQDLPGWHSEKLVRFLPALSAQCHYLASVPANTALGGSPFLEQRSGSVAYWASVCEALRYVNPQDETAARAFVERWFKPYRISGDKKGRVTGYYEPEIRGSLYRQGIYQTPVYARPPELKTVNAEDGSMQSGFWYNNQFVPYWSRAQIDSGVLANRKLELLWIASPIDLFFLQIQGSGRVVLDDGRIVRLAYAGKNGQPYYPIGRLLVERGELGADNVSMQTVQAWLKQHPEQALGLMEKNPSYVFFRKLAPEQASELLPWQGAPGSMGIGLVPQRSVAVDRSYLPLGSLLWVTTQVPSVKTGQYKKWNHLVLAQDTGADIRGPERIDLYMGWGEKAAWQAGYLHQPSAVYVLVPRQAKTSLKQ